MFTENHPLLPSKTLKLITKAHKVGSATGILPWRLQPEVKNQPLVNRTGRWTAWLQTLNLAYPYALFANTAFLTFYGIVFQGWGQIQITFSMLTLGLIFLSMLAGFELISNPNGFAASARENLKHVHFLNGIVRTDAPPPPLVNRSHLAMELIVLMTYSNTLVAALITLLIPWFPVGISNILQIVFGNSFTFPWKAVTKAVDFGIAMYAGHQCGVLGMVLVSTLHCFSICNTAVLKDFLLKEPSLMQLRSSEKYHIIVQIIRRIELLNIGIGETFSLFILMQQTLIILVASTALFAAIKFGGLLGIGLAVVGVFFVVILIAFLTYCSLLGETMAELKDQLERECRAHALLRRQVRCMRPAYVNVASFYHVDKQCILTCCMIIVDTVFNALVMTENG